MDTLFTVICCNRVEAPGRIQRSNKTIMAIASHARARASELLQGADVFNI